MRPRGLGAGRAFDVTVVGGGVVGGTLAALLGRAGFSVALVDAGDVPRFDPEGFALRVYAITQASRNILAAAGAWPLIAGERHGTFRRMEVWDAAGPGRIEFDAAAVGEPTLGWIVEAPLINVALDRATHALPAVTWMRQARVEGCTLEADGVTLQLADGRRVASRLVVGADGAASRVRELAGIGQTRLEYEQTALVAVVRTELPHEDTARQRFLPGGPLAFLPLAAPDSCSIVWSSHAAEAERLLALPEAAFNAELEEAFEQRLGAVVSSGPRASFPLVRSHAETYVAPRVALVGDAAHTIHPLAGQGANLGLLDAATLAELLVEARGRGREPGDPAVLRRFERRRRGENQLMQSLMDGFNWLFGERPAPVRWLRGAGLRLTDALAPAKTLIIRQAMGLAGELPRAARGEPAG